jgi:hypothetical protein
MGKKEKHRHLPEIDLSKSPEGRKGSKILGENIVEGNLVENIKRTAQLGRNAANNGLGKRFH